MQPSDLIDELGLQPHPEGGWYRELYRSSLRVEAPQGARSALTTIYYLLERQQVSRWHVVAADEVWHFYAGTPLQLALYRPGTHALRVIELGAPDQGREPVCVVPAGCWQAARPSGPFALVGCSVGPGFEFEDFHLVADLPDHAPHFAGALQSWRALL